MENQNVESSGQAQEVTATIAENIENPGAETTNTVTQDTNTAAQSVDELPDWAQSEIRKAREEAAKYRTRAKTAAEEATQQGEAARAQLIQDLGKQLGLVEDDTSDPEKLIAAAQESATAAATERDQLREQLNTYRRSDAIRGAVSKVDGNVDTELLNALLRSDNAFNALEIGADDFDAQVAEIVGKQLESHPSLIQAIRKASGVDPSNTQAGAGKPITRDDLKTMSPSEINQAARDGKLAHLMQK